MDFELLLKFIGYFLDCLSALSHMFLHFFGQPLSKQLYLHDCKSAYLVETDTTPGKKILQMYNHTDLA